jgi:hypothetical protein
MTLVTDVSIACFIGIFVIFNLIVSRYLFIIFIASIAGIIMMYREHREQIKLDKMTDRAIRKALKKVFREEPLYIVDINGKRSLERIQ